MAKTEQALLQVENLSVRFPTRFGEFTAVKEVDLVVNAGDIHGLVGESGAGKSTIGAAILGLLPGTGYISEGKISLLGDSLRELSAETYHQLRGARISMIFQDPQTSLNPLLTISEQLVETIRQHSDLSVQAAKDRALELLLETGIHDADQRLDNYPHQFSGGMRQRVVIALALCTDPELIIADEPTTALDVSVQKQILQLLQTLAQSRGVGFILITHDIGVIAQVTNRVTVLRNGRVMESGQTQQVLRQPKNDYTQALMAAVPRLETRLNRFVNIVDDDPTKDIDLSWQIEGASADVASEWLLNSTNAAANVDESVILQVKDLEVAFNKGRPGWFKSKDSFKALSGISLNVGTGSVLGVIGESGSGKSTLAKAITGLVQPSSGQLYFQGESLPFAKQRSRSHPVRQAIQMIFQDPYSSLNNRRTVEDIISEPIRFYKLSNSRSEQRKLVASMLDLVEMPQQAMLKYPHQFSGGQRQRIAVARSLVARPSFLICDEPTSALDVSIQAQILNLLKDLQSHFGLSILFISHNLAVVRQMADNVIVLKRGRLVESANSEEFFNHPKAQYSKQLLAESPSLEY
ncbi:MAG: ABC transporter ATP-binding protein [Gammaproteobacteria bacterium]|nr:ABC transporter ATP-binding protein [Gammaproteobacteria bacterium]